ncbi:MAG: AbrB/MazE/SpoVT family DNA-binding domain-containing protein [Caulobacteraceae bacterium]
MRITVKGQVTIPAPVRRELHLRPGDEVRFVRDGAKIVLEKQGPDGPDARAKRIEDWLERFAGSASDCPWTTEEILDMTRGSDRHGP